MWYLYEKQLQLKGPFLPAAENAARYFANSSSISAPRGIGVCLRHNSAGTEVEQRLGQMTPGMGSILHAVYRKGLEPKIISHGRFWFVCVSKCTRLPLEFVSFTKQQHGDSGDKLGSDLCCAAAACFGLGDCIFTEALTAVAFHDRWRAFSPNGLWTYTVWL